MVESWLLKACRLYYEKPCKENKRRVFEVINLIDALREKDSAKLKRAYNFLITLPDTEEVREVLKRIEGERNE